MLRAATACENADAICSVLQRMPCSTLRFPAWRGHFYSGFPNCDRRSCPGVGFAGFSEDGAKGLPLTLPQAVEQKRAGFVVFGGQPGKGSNQCAPERTRLTLVLPNARSFLSSREFRDGATIVRGINVRIAVVNRPPSTPLPINGNSCHRIAGCRSVCKPRQCLDDCG